MLWGGTWGFGSPWGGDALISDHKDQAIAKLMEQYRCHPLINALVCVLVERLQGVEDVLSGIVLGRSIDTAQGQQLDDIGAWLCVPRFTADDEAYRLLLRFKISTILPNTATIPKLLEIAVGLTEQITGSTNGVGLAEYYPAAYCITLPIQGEPLEKLARDIMFDAHPAGVGACDIIYNPDCYLGFDATTGPAPSGMKPFESTSAPGDGGLWASVDV